MSEPIKASRTNEARGASVKKIEIVSTNPKDRCMLDLRFFI